MVSKLVGVRLPSAAYERLQALKRELGLSGDAETIRRIIEEFPSRVRPSMMPVFTAPIRSAAPRRARHSAARHDEALYGE